MTATAYDPREFKALTFHDATPRFRDGADTPRAYLERCLETISARAPVVKAFAAINDAAARDPADASAPRRKAGNPPPPTAGMPVPTTDLPHATATPTRPASTALEDTHTEHPQA